jgi:hypothetical protein
MLKQAMAQNGLIAILRGLRPEESVAIGQVLYDAGFRIIEVPLNSPQPYDSIRLLRNSLPADCLIGAGTVLSAEQVQQVKAAGGQLIVMPHSDPAVLKAAKEAEMYLAPGVVTPTEAFAGRGQGLAGSAAQGHGVGAGWRGHPGQHAAVPGCRGGGFRLGLGPVQARHDGATGGRECQGVLPGLAVADGRTALNRTYCGHR